MLGYLLQGQSVLLIEGKHLRDEVFEGLAKEFSLSWLVPAVGSPKG